MNQMTKWVPGGYYGYCRTWNHYSRSNQTLRTMGAVFWMEGYDDGLTIWPGLQWSCLSTMLVMYNGYFVLTMFNDYDWWLKSNDIDKYMIKLSHGKSTYMTMSILWLWPMLWYPYDTMSMSIWLCLYLCLWLCLWSKMSTMNDIRCMISLCLFMTDEVTYFRILTEFFEVSSEF